MRKQRITSKSIKKYLEGSALTLYRLRNWNAHDDFGANVLVEEGMGVVVILQKKVDNQRNNNNAVDRWANSMRVRSGVFKNNLASKNIPTAMSKY